MLESFFLLFVFPLCHLLDKELLCPFGLFLILSDVISLPLPLRHYLSASSSLLTSPPSPSLLFPVTKTLCPNLYCYHYFVISRISLFSFLVLVFFHPSVSCYFTFFPPLLLYVLREPLNSHMDSCSSTKLTEPSIECFPSISLALSEHLKLSQLSLDRICFQFCNIGRLLTSSPPVIQENGPFLT
jgi:hypothetical protein